MKSPKIIYILVGVFCLFALISAIYFELFVKDENKGSALMPGLIEQEPVVEEKTQEELKTQLSELFDNTFKANGYDSTNINKLNSEKDIVYSAYDIQEKKENYEVDVHLPVMNIKGEVPVSFNKITQTVFVDKTSEILSNKIAEKTIFSVKYVSYINGDILSLIIQSTLKTGNNPQRVVLQTYNYNLATGEEVKLEDILSQKNIIQSECQEKIDKIVTRAQEEAQILVQSGYTVYNRDLSKEMYKIRNVSNYFLGTNGELYVIFAYGNNNFTSEMDIVFYE